MSRPRLSPLGAFLLLACREPLPDDIAVLRSPRVLAVRSDPAEAAPGEEVTLTALYLDASGEVNPARIDWSFCVDRKPLSELGPVSATCLAPNGPGLAGIGQGAIVGGVLPEDGCRLFGPDPPEPKANEPAGRPVDADRTGGYYQPVRVSAADVTEPVIGFARMACGLADATPPIAKAFTEQYVPNTNPRVESFLEDDVVVAKPGADVELRVAWPTCDGSAPCEGAESYVRFDPERRELVDTRESLRVSWFATSGRFAIDHTGRDGTDPARSSANVWSAPDDAGDVVFVVVLRDDRGGVGWRRVRARVE